VRLPCLANPDLGSSNPGKVGASKKSIKSFIFRGKNTFKDEETRLSFEHVHKKR